jgi:hypothetical protein
MPRQPTVYDAVLISPPEPNITFYLDTREPLSLEVWQDTKTMAKLIKCDLCGRFMLLSGANLLTAALKKHRRKQTCQEYFNKHATHQEAVDENPLPPSKPRLHMSKPSKTIKISSDCEYHYQNMKYHPAMKPTIGSPCTNVPILCPICPQPETF